MNLTLALRGALRTKLRTVVRLSLTANDIAVTAAGYTRVAGSFIADGWQAGDEVTGVGFPVATNNAPRLVHEVGDKVLNVLAGSVPLTAAGVGPLVTLQVATPKAFALPGRTFDPPNLLPYMRESLMPAASTPQSMGPKKRIENRGIYEISLLYPQDYGSNAQDAMADAIVDAFYPGQTLTMGGYNVRITSAEAAAALTETGYSRVPVSIGYIVYTITPQ